MNLFGRRDQEDEIRKMGRLPPGQALTNRFPVLHYGSVPRYDLKTWDFRIFGEVEEEKRFTWDEFNALPKRKITMDIHCVTRWSKFDTEWEGIWLPDLINQGIIKLKPAAKFVIEHCEHGFTTNLDIAHFMKPTTLIATKFNGEPLEPDHGYPVRVVVGALKDTAQDVDTRYFWKGGKWVRGLEFSRTDKPGFWEQAGYHNIARVWPEERFE
ncbi:MAG TPA: sulfite oxidase-like oxidoreductase [Thermoflexales bacterium]|nr:sulfite oxidase-like oxidoreductase [Thermoflexales bacterium]HQW34794.1 sulfite oxidase-like oxidoreductase [Thermoflexales bacterium]HQZ22679.1 sulfite oxidase-like oxidoreductase [Thermoflexales bacterium]HRA00278.1 sulfite oxidase-like oxidoreductase [Thermoflexales bacterium]